MRMLTPALGRNRGYGSLKDLQQRLLHSLTGNIAGYRWVFRFARDLVDLVYVDDPGLGLLDVEVCRLNELQEDVLDILTHVAGLGEGRRISHCERHIEHLRQGLSKICLPTTSGPDQQNVRFSHLDGLFTLARTTDPGLLGGDALVVIVDGDRECFLGRILSDHVLVEEITNLLGLWEFFLQPEGFNPGKFFLNDFVAQPDALIADVDAITRDEALDLFLRLGAEVALEDLAGLTDPWHR